ncbi:ATP synthase F1 subunit gamma [Myroides sp. LJL116]
MANLKEIRNRISSIGSTMQITSAMKMVSAAKLKKATDTIEAMRPYSEKLTEIIQNISATLEGDNQGVYSQEREINNVLLVVVTSNRGLCGAFNANIIKQVNLLKESTFKDANVDILTIGKKGYDALSKVFNVFENDSDFYDHNDFEHCAVIAEKLMSAFVEQKYDSIQIVYNQFKNAATQNVVTEQFLPLLPIEVEQSNAVAMDYIYEPSKEDILDTLIPMSLKTQLFKAVSDSVASEHGARMTAMHKATDNANDLRNDLKLTYNKARQAAITNEILEIVGGAEALGK